MLAALLYLPFLFYWYLLRFQLRWRKESFSGAASGKRGILLSVDTAASFI
jgi:hypothetical protein